MEVHHIKAEADGGTNTFENAIPLCFDCHAIVRQYDPRHPKGTKFTEKELVQHRDNWYAKIRNEIPKDGEKAAPKIDPIKIVRNADQNFMLQRVMTGRELVALASDICANQSFTIRSTKEEIKPFCRDLTINFTASFAFTADARNPGRIFEKSFGFFLKYPTITP